MSGSWNSIMATFICPMTYWYCNLFHLAYVLNVCRNSLPARREALIRCFKRVSSLSSTYYLSIPKILMNWSRIHYSQINISGANAQNNPSVPGKPVASMPATNLNIGMDLWNASSGTKMRPNASAVPPDNWVQVWALLIILSHINTLLSCSNFQHDGKKRIEMI